MATATAGVTEKGQPVCCEGDQNMIDPGEITVGELLHKGTYGDIYKATYNGRTVAVKKFTVPKLGQSAANVLKKELLNEYGNLKTVRGDGVVKDEGICCDSEKGIYWVVMEYLPYNLKQVLADTQFPLSWNQKVELALKVCQTMQHLHNRVRPFFIRRMSSNSFLLNEEKNGVKICGLGFLKTRSSAARNPNVKSTIKYIPPEHLMDISCVYTEKSEAYGLGIVLWEIATRRQPFEGKSDSEVCKIVIPGDMEELPAECPPEFKNVIDQLRVKNTGSRITVDDAFQRLSAIVN